MDCVDSLPQSTSQLTSSAFSRTSRHIHTMKFNT